MKIVKNLKIDEDWLYHKLDARKLHKIIKSGGLKARRRLSREDRRGLENGIWNGGYYVSFAKKAEGKDTAYDHYIEGEFAFIYDSNMNAVKTKVKPVGSIFETIAKLPISKRFSRWKEEYQVKDFAPFGNLVGIKIPHGHRFLGVYESDEDYQKRQLNKILRVLDAEELDVPFIDVEEGKVVPKELLGDYLDNKIKKEKSNKSK